MTLAFNRDELQAYLEEVFAEVMDVYCVETLTEDTVQMRLKVGAGDLRPGGTISGPSMFSLADVAVYAMVLARIGREALTVTTNASIDFMRKPEGGTDLIADCRLLKLGRALAVCDVLIRSEGSDRIVARSSMTYSIPPKGPTLA